MCKEAPANFKSFLVFRIGNKLFGINSNEIRGIYDLNYIYQIDGRKYINIGDLKAFLVELRLSKTDDGDKSCIIIIDVFNSGTLTGIIVDEVKILVDVNCKDFIEKPRIGDEYDESYYVGKFAKFNNDIFGIINTQKLIEYCIAEMEYTSRIKSQIQLL